MVLLTISEELPLAPATNLRKLAIPRIICLWDYVLPTYGVIVGYVLDDFIDWFNVSVAKVTFSERNTSLLLFNHCFYTDVTIRGESGLQQKKLGK